MEESHEDLFFEWILKAVDVLKCSNPAPCMISSKTKFGLITIPTTPIVLDRKLFFNQHERFVIEMSENQKWIFTFDPARDIVPTARTIEKSRRDQTLYRRLCVALRALISVTRLVSSSDSAGMRMYMQEHIGSPPLSPVGFRVSTPTDSKMRDIMSIGSSFGMLRVQLRQQGAFLKTPESGPLIPAHSAPSGAEFTLDEEFIKTQSSALISAAAAVGGIEMVIEEHASLPRIASSGSMGSGRSFPAYSYQSSSEFILPRSPQQRSPSSDEEQYDWEATETTVEEWVIESPQNLKISKWIEKPQSVVSLVNEIDRIRASRSPPQSVAVSAAQLNV